MIRDHKMSSASSGVFHFDDGGSFAGEVVDMQASGSGVARGFGGRGEFAGSWRLGFPERGVYKFSCADKGYEGELCEGRRHGLGVDKSGNWIYEGEWSNGFRGRYGQQKNIVTNAMFQGTWSDGMKDGYGAVTYADGGKYHGQWLRGCRHGYGIRQSATYERARFSLRSYSNNADCHVIPNALEKNTKAARNDDVLPRNNNYMRLDGGGGFVLTEHGVILDSRGSTSLLSISVQHEVKQVRKPMSFSGFHKRKHLSKNRPNSESTSLSQTHLQTRSLQEINGNRVDQGIAAEAAAAAAGREEEGLFHVDSDEFSFIDEGFELEGTTVEHYMGEWQNDRRTGFGTSIRSDGLKYEGEWLKNKKHGYGRTTLIGGRKLEGKYKNNILVTSVQSIQSKIFSLQSRSILEKVENAVREAQMAADNAKQKMDIAIIRMSTAAIKAQESVAAAESARKEAERARYKAASQMQHSQPGEQLKIYRLVEEEFLKEFLSTVKTTFPVLLSSNSRFQLFQRKHNNMETNAPPVSSKAFLFFRRKSTEKMQTGSRTMYAPPPPSPQQHQLEWDSSQLLQQPSVFKSMQTNQKSNVYTKYPETDYHFENKVMEKVTVPLHQNVATSLTRQKQCENGEEAKIDDVMSQPRRKSLPSIIKEKSINIDRSINDRSTKNNPVNRNERPTITETFVIENGKKKRVKSLYDEDTKVIRKRQNTSNSTIGSGVMTSLVMMTLDAGFAVTRSTPLRTWMAGDNNDTSSKKMYTLEPVNLERKSKGGSTPDVSAVKECEILPREQVYVMSQKKREENIRKREETNQRRKNSEFVISFSNWRDILGLLLLFLVGLTTILFVNNSLDIGLLN